MNDKLKEGDVCVLSSAIIIDNTQIRIKPGSTALVLGFPDRPWNDKAHPYGRQYELIRVLVEGFITRVCRYRLERTQDQEKHCG